MPGSIFLKNDKFCVKSITDYMDPYFKLKPPDCYLYAEDGYKFDIHKVCLQIFFQFFSQFALNCSIVRNKRTPRGSRSYGLFPDSIVIIYVVRYSQVSIKRAGLIKRGGWNFFEK